MSPALVPQDPAPLDITSLVRNLAMSAFFGFCVAWHYKRFGRAITNRSELAHVFPLISLTTTLVITVVKSSLALSLG